MLRYEYLPSDFHPKFLILGEGADFAALAGMLRAFAAAPTAVAVADAITPTPKGPPFAIVPVEDDHGLRDLDGRYEWRINAWQAEAIATRLDVLADPATINGSDLLELGSAGEIPVAVSLGEFPDAYLHTRGA